MNFSTTLGFLGALAVFTAGVITSSKDVAIFLNLHAIIIVAGGTIATSLICFPLKQMIMLLGVFFKRIIGNNKRNYVEIISDIVALAHAARVGSKELQGAAQRVKEHFLRDAVEILEWATLEINAEQLRDLLETRVETHLRRYMGEANIFRAVSKLPPAFGLMGTTLGMISLLQSLGEDGAQNKIGPSMAIALVATLYGITFANFFFIPIAENLTKQTEEDNVARRIVVEGVMMIHGKLPPKFIEEKLKSFLLPRER